jgi:AcrR family transcriptional regulator
MATLAAGHAPAYPPRATRAAGRRTRRALLDAAAVLFAERGFSGVSLADIAAVSGTFPSQVTYYFGSKEALFVEAASRDVLHLAARVEAAGARAASREQYARVMAREALRSRALLTFAEALLLARQRPELGPLVARTVDRLHTEGARAVHARCAAAGWSLWAPAEAVARDFWAVVLGLVLTRAGSGGALDHSAAEGAVLAALAVEYPHKPASTARRRAGGPSRRPR